MTHKQRQELDRKLDEESERQSAFLEHFIQSSRPPGTPPIMTSRRREELERKLTEDDERSSDFNERLRNSQ